MVAPAVAADHSMGDIALVGQEIPHQQVPAKATMVERVTLALHLVLQMLAAAAVVQVLLVQVVQITRVMAARVARELQLL